MQPVGLAFAQNHRIAPVRGVEKCRQIQLYGCVEGLYLPEQITVYMIVRSFDLPYESYASCCYPAESQFGVLRHDFVGVFFKVFSGGT